MSQGGRLGCKGGPHHKEDEGMRESRGFPVVPPPSTSPAAFGFLIGWSSPHSHPPPLATAHRAFQGTGGESKGVSSAPDNPATRLSRLAGAKTREGGGK